MKCPKCSSHRFSVRLDNGLERVIVFFTKMRKYRCKECGLAFRAPDRRKTPRVDAAAVHHASRAAQSLP